MPFVGGKGGPGLLRSLLWNAFLRVFCGSFREFFLGLFWRLFGRHLIFRSGGIWRVGHLAIFFGDFLWLFGDFLWYFDDFLMIFWKQSQKRKTSKSRQNISKKSQKVTRKSPKNHQKISKKSQIITKNLAKSPKNHQKKSKKITKKSPKNHQKMTHFAID